MLKPTARVYFLVNFALFLFRENILPQQIHFQTKLDCNIIIRYYTVQSIPIIYMNKYWKFMKAENDL